MDSGKCDGRNAGPSPENQRNQF